MRAVACTLLAAVLAATAAYSATPAAGPLPPAPTAPMSARAEVQDALDRVLALVAEYRPGTPVDPALDARVRSAVDALERAAGAPPDVAANPASVDGVWLCVYDTRDLLHVAGMRIMSGGRYPDAKIPARTTIQELRPAQGWYRNTVVLAAGPQQIPVNYEATAKLSLDPAAPNVFRVQFERLAFVPADARHDAAAVRAALGLPADAPLVIDVPPGPASPSTVVYVDDAVRINRGKAYVSVLKRLR